MDYAKLKQACLDTLEQIARPTDAELIKIADVYATLALAEATFNNRINNSQLYVKVQ